MHTLCGVESPAKIWRLGNYDFKYILKNFWKIMVFDWIPMHKFENLIPVPPYKTIMLYSNGIKAQFPNKYKYFSG